MKKRLAVYSRTQNFWGGSFQYAKAFTQALAELDREKYDIQVWHQEDEEWSQVCADCGFKEHILDQYVFPPQMMPAIKKIYQALTELPEDNIEQRSDLLNQLSQFSTERELERFAPHIVANPQMGLPRFYPGARHIGVIHDLMHRYEQHFPEVGEPQEINAREKLFTDITNNCDVILVDSKTGAEHVQECYPSVRPEQLKILPFSAFTEIVDCQPLKPAFDLPEKFLFYPAQFWLHKNHCGLARALALIRAEIPDMTIVATGNVQKNGFSSFMEIVNKEGLKDNFILPGYVSAGELKWLYQHARALIMPTFFGPTNIPPLEAMALGCPVAVSGIYGMSEQCGQAAIYFDPGNDSEIASTMKRLWQDDALCKNLSEKGLERAKWYDVKIFGKQVRRIVESLN